MSKASPDRWEETACSSQRGSVFTGGKAERADCFLRIWGSWRLKSGLCWGEVGMGEVLLNKLVGARLDFFFF